MARARGVQLVNVAVIFVIIVCLAIQLYLSGDSLFTFFVPSALLK